MKLKCSYCYKGCYHDCIKLVEHPFGIEILSSSNDVIKVINSYEEFKLFMEDLINGKIERS